MVFNAFLIGFYDYLFVPLDLILLLAERENRKNQGNDFIWLLVPHPGGTRFFMRLRITGERLLFRDHFLPHFVIARERGLDDRPTADFIIIARKLYTSNSHFSSPARTPIHSRVQDVRTLYAVDGRVDVKQQF